MSNYPETYSLSAADSEPSIRAAFIRRTYGHLAGAILAFIALEGVLQQTELPAQMLHLMSGTPYSWLIVMALFMGAGFVANNLARSEAGPAIQYVGLGLYVVAWAIMFMPVIFIGNLYYDGLIEQAGIITLLLFGGLTATVFMTRKDFSFLGPIVTIGMFVALGIIIAGILFGFSLGIVFSGAMVLLVAASILYTTSNVLHHYAPNQHVAASLALFSGIATMLWYIIHILMSLTSSD